MRTTTHATLRNNRVYEKRYNTIVIGMGAMGSATAYYLARRGKRVLGLERFDIPHDMGSYQGYTRIIRMPEMTERLVQMGVDPMGGTPEEFGRLIKSETERFGKAVKASGAKAD